MSSSAWTIVFFSVLAATSTWIPFSGGQLSFGTPAIIGVGAYAAAIALREGWTDSPSVALLLSIVAGCVAGVMVALPSLRLKDFPYAIVTLGLTEAFRVVVIQMDVTNGAQGIPVRPQGIFALALATVVVVLGSVWSIYRSKFGLKVALLKAAPDGLITETAGLRTRGLKLILGGIAGLFGGAAGAVLAMYSGYIEPSMFGFAMSIQLLAMVIAGGVGTWWGPATGAMILTLAVQELSILGTYRLVVFGAVLAVMVIVLPEGVMRPIPSLRARFVRRRLARGGLVASPTQANAPQSRRLA